VQSLWNAKEIFITENGCASDDVIADIMLPRPSGSIGPRVLPSTAL
jgi:hypothetical protein